ncbi:MAG: hypothetical protein CM1200mP10_19420 [Candidatus Neomarinimicrobiota bacterium]|nr:MAG: hypothetical protein CM1200mP10_19420 [Candidatus Neomarinimicrobiota bacterium]
MLIFFWLIVFFCRSGIQNNALVISYCCGEMNFEASGKLPLKLNLLVLWIISGPMKTVIPPIMTQPILDYAIFPKK